MEFWVDILGWTGALLILLAYALISFRKIDAGSLNYQLLNIFGSIFLVTNTYYYGAIPSTLVNLIWVVIGLAAVSALLKKWKRDQQVDI